MGDRKQPTPPPEVTRPRGSAMLGYFGRDLITGFGGLIIGRCEYISGCTQLLLQPKIDGDGKVPDARWIDEQRIGVEPGMGFVALDNSETPGCDLPAPIR